MNKLIGKYNAISQISISQISISSQERHIF